MHPLYFIVIYSHARTIANYQDKALNSFSYSSLLYTYIKIISPSTFDNSKLYILIAHILVSLNRHEDALNSFSYCPRYIHTKKQYLHFDNSKLYISISTFQIKLSMWVNLEHNKICQINKVTVQSVHVWGPLFSRLGLLHCCSRHHNYNIQSKQFWYSQYMVKHELYRKKTFLKLIDSVTWIISLYQKNK